MRFATGRSTSTVCPNRAKADVARVVRALLRTRSPKERLREAEDRSSEEDRRNSSNSPPGADDFNH